ncbi:mitofusin [Scheffersomyces spartinae]|uniref:Mitofusin n=1 Tax=Scheffersomyces spartinae TaxID=45513 RepID=A0A9P7V819_9ASCO|nr:mitofusin [Scheffersomyces spartinae]KAG7192977.1 mitofusin [Scheffersomyces spartinae]
MSYKEFVHLKYASERAKAEMESMSEDGATLVDGDNTRLTAGDNTNNNNNDDYANDDFPAQVVYIPDEHQFTEDSQTLIEGSSSSSSKVHRLGGSKLMKKRTLESSVQQIRYNDNKLALDRSIHQTIELLYELSRENEQRPVFYPTTTISSENSQMLNSAKAHLAFIRNKKVDAKSLNDFKVELDSLPDFKVLRINVQLDRHPSNNVVADLDKKSIAKLLQLKIQLQVKYLLNLKDRIDDTSSKVFVTGDLNSGKSTFCNALLRRKILPEDQQPCTSVFCEVIDAKKENHGTEEVHAIPIGKEYSARDQTTYEIYPLKALEDLVGECDKYSLLKVYVLEGRKFHESLLHNGVIDIKLIDAPGLNMDSYQTTQVFSRQEEIDLVVFVVSAENHFTLSAKEFISAAAAEKRYVFIVVNKFDNIRDKNKCMSKILEQVKSLSPDTYKNALEFVHFVSAEDFVPPDGDGDDDDDDDGDDDNNNNNNDDPNFDNLEASLKKFILEKRSISKLLPAKSFLLNILNDLETLSTINEKIYIQEKEENMEKLRTSIVPKYNEVMKKSHKIAEAITTVIEETCTKVYDETKLEIIDTTVNFGDSPVVPFVGFQYLYEYAKQTQVVMIDSILSCIQKCEEETKVETEKVVDRIILFGKNNLGDEFLQDKVFKSDLMFTRKRDTIKKQLGSLIYFSDFFDPNWESFLVWLGIPKSYVQSTQDHINQYNPIAALATIPSSVQSLKNTISSPVTLQTIYASGKILTAGAVVRKVYDASYYVTPSNLKQIATPLLLGVSSMAIIYLVSDMPNAFPRNQAKKLRKQIVDLDYAHVNATRMAQECRQVLNYPSRQVMNNFQTTIDKRSVEKEELERAIKDSELSYGYFHDLLRKVQSQKQEVDDIDLETIHSVE